MTTDRTAATTRSTALAPPAAGRTPAPSSDMFSALLGAATPESDAPARRDDAPRSQPRDDAPKPGKANDEPTASDATAASEAPVTTEPAEETPTAPTTP